MHCGNAPLKVRAPTTAHAPSGLWWRGWPDGRVRTQTSSALVGHMFVLGHRAGTMTNDTRINRLLRNRESACGKRACMHAQQCMWLLSARPRPCSVERAAAVACVSQIGPLTMCYLAVVFDLLSRCLLLHHVWDRCQMKGLQGKLIAGA
jgi:hypothetical protein